MKVVVVAAALAAAGTAFATEPPTTTPIHHVVVIFQENVSFDHYFGTYPRTKNPPGEPSFTALPNTPSVNGLTSALLHHNPNLANPYRLDHSQALTCDQTHAYTAEQRAYNAGMMNRFVQVNRKKDKRQHCSPTTVMGYFDGNTVTALWNYAQHFAMSDNFYGTAFGPSTPGALNLVSGNTRLGARTPVTGVTAAGAVIGDHDPEFDDCSHGHPMEVEGRNIGDLLNAKGVTWGWFEGGFQPTSHKDGKPVCGSRHKNIGGDSIRDYIPHHEPFQYYRSTANPQHLPPRSVANIGHAGPANHQYGLEDFRAALKAGDLPAVSYLKARGYQDGHAGYSDPLDEQHFIVRTVNALMQSKYWPHLAIIITYDDSDGWYDQAMPPILIPSHVKGVDVLFGEKRGCGHPRKYTQGRCGFGPRLPLLVISPYAKVNYVSHKLNDQASVLRFIEDNWKLGRIGHGSADAISGSLDDLFDFEKPHAKQLFLDAKTGEPVDAVHAP
ncbi:MAG: phospholipase C [Gammaproteobacteria bacterium]